MADEKLRALEAAVPAADELVGCDTSCLLHLQARAEAIGQPLRTRHLAEVLAAALPPDGGHERDAARPGEGEGHRAAGGSPAARRDAARPDEAGAAG